MLEYELDPHGGVTASPQLTPLVAERRDVQEVSAGPPRGWEPTTGAVLLDTTAVGDDGVSLWTRRDREEVLASLAARSYELEYRAAGIFLVVREPT